MSHRFYKSPFGAIVYAHPVCMHVRCRQQYGYGYCILENYIHIHIYLEINTCMLDIEFLLIVYCLLIAMYFLSAYVKGLESETIERLQHV